MNAIHMHTAWREIGFDFVPLGAAVGFIGHDSTEQRTLQVLGDELGITRAELGLSFTDKRTHAVSMSILAIFLGVFFPAWQDGDQWLKRNLKHLSNGSAVKPVERDGWRLKLTHDVATALLVARVEKL